MLSSLRTVTIEGSTDIFPFRSSSASPSGRNLNNRNLFYATILMPLRLLCMDFLREVSPRGSDPAQTFVATNVRTRKRSRAHQSCAASFRAVADADGVKKRPLEVLLVVSDSPHLRSLRDSGRQHAEHAWFFDFCRIGELYMNCPVVFRFIGIQPARTLFLTSLFW